MPVEPLLHPIDNQWFNRSVFSLLKKGTHRLAISTFFRHDYYLILARLAPYFKTLSICPGYQQIEGGFLGAL